MSGRHRLTPDTADASRPAEIAKRRPRPHARPAPTPREQRAATDQIAAIVEPVQVPERPRDARPEPLDDAPLLTDDDGDHGYSADNDGLAGKAVRGATATLGGQMLRVALQLATLIVLARLLSPGDYGLLAEIIAIVGIGEVIRDFGLSSAAMQATRITSAQRSNLFWINSAIGATLGVAAFLLAPALVNLYDDPNLLQPARVIAITFLFNGMAAQFQADLNRKLKYGRVITADVGSQAIAFSVAIALAVNGAGYWALVAQQVVSAGTALTIVVLLDDWRPGRPQRHAEMRPFWTYGWALFGTQMLGYTTRNIDSVVIGVRFGATALGFYERAFQVLMLPLNQINAPLTRVALPVLARLQHSAAEFRAFLFRGQTLLTNATVGVFAFGAALSEPLFGLVFGAKWEASVPIFQVLAVAGMFQAVSYPAYWAFLALALTRANLYSALLSRPLVAAGIVIGSNWGVLGVAYGYAAGLFTVWPIEMVFIHRNTEVSGWQLFWRGLKPLLSWLAVAAPTYLALRYTDWSYLESLGYGVLIFAVSFGLAVAVLPAFRREMTSVTTALAMMRPARPGTPAEVVAVDTTAQPTGS